jgi:hypothetical protein
VLVVFALRAQCGRDARDPMIQLSPASRAPDCFGWADPGVALATLASPQAKFCRR